VLDKHIAFAKANQLLVGICTDLPYSLPACHPTPAAFAIVFAVGWA
jgi:hypothetical protein